MTYLNSLNFVHIKSAKNINYISINKVKRRKKKAVIKVLRRVALLYLTRGFVITDLYTDNEFN